MSFDDLTITAEKIDHVQIIKLQGSLSAFTEQSFRQYLDKSLKKGPVILDMEEVNLVSSVGIQTLKEVNQLSYLYKTKFVLLNTPQPVMKAFQMSGIRGLVLFAGNEEDALRMTQKAGRG